MMQKVIGLTGGIGSGKTTVAIMFKELGVPIYIADVEAKKLMLRSKVIRRKLIALFGDTVYLETGLNKPLISEKIFNDTSLLAKMNAIVHPKVKTHFLRWCEKQDYPYVIKEAAILFENGSYKSFDAIITVTASEEEKIKRIIKRDNSSVKKVKQIMKNQWSDEKKIALSDFVIHNDDLKQTKLQVQTIHNALLKQIKTTKH